jgi:hypothetical protein
MMMLMELESFAAGHIFLTDTGAPIIGSKETIASDHNFIVDNMIVDSPGDSDIDAKADTDISKVYITMISVYKQIYMYIYVQPAAVVCTSGVHCSTRQHRKCTMQMHCK